MKYAIEELKAGLKNDINFQPRKIRELKEYKRQLQQAMSTLEMLENPEELVEKYAEKMFRSEMGCKEALQSMLNEIKGEGE